MFTKSVLPELARVRGHTIWTRNLGPSSVVVDAGAHLGEFSRRLIDAYHCRCYLVEANPELVSRLKERGLGETLSVALSPTDGRSSFIFRSNAEAGSVLAGPSETRLKTVEVEAVSLETLMRRAGLSRIDVLKLDIEGTEFDLIAQTADEVLCSIGQISVEFHDFLPQFKSRGLFERARVRLESLGFLCCRISFRTHGDVLFVNRRRLEIGAVSALGISTFARLAARRTSL